VPLYYLRRRFTFVVFECVVDTINTVNIFDVHISVHRKCISKVRPTRKQEAMFSSSVYLHKLLYMFQTVPLPIIMSTKLYIQHQLLSNQYCCPLLSWMRWAPSHPWWQEAAVLVWQYLVLYVQFCAPDDGWRNCLKHVEQFMEINRSRRYRIMLVVL
jgi:hypothetical protein